MGAPPAKPPPELDELDLPAPVSSGPADDFDLPAPASARFDELDLPAPASSGPVDELDLPALASSSGFDEIDLPAASGGDLDELDLPMRSADDLFGDLDLPMSAAAAAPGPGGDELDLPALADESLGDLDLPMPAFGASAPVGRDSLDDLPAVSSGFGEIAVASPSLDLDLPRPAADLPRTQSVAPQASAAVRARAPESGPATSGANETWRGSVAPPAPAHRPSAPAGAAADVQFGEVDLGGGGEADLDGAGEIRAVSPELGGEADIFGSLDVDADALSQLTSRSASATASAGEAAPRSIKGPIVVLVVTALLVGAGAALALTPHGLFGRYYFEQYLAAAGTPAEAQGMLDSAETRARTDAYEDVRASVRDLARARQTLGLNRSLLSRSIVHEALYQVRFGDDSASSERIVRALGRLEERHGDAPGMELARAAAALAKRDLVAALDHVESARAAAGDSDPYVELVAGEAHLVRGNPKGAVAAFARAAELGGGARALYGQSRATQAGGGDATALDELLQATLEASPRHVAARTDRARLLLAEGELDEARRLAREAAGIDAVEGATLTGARRERASAFTVLGLIEERAANRSEALAAFEDSNQLDPTSMIPVYGAGRVLLADNRARDALVRFEAASRSARPHETHQGRAVSLAAQLDAVQAELSLGAVDEARGRVVSLVQANPDDPLALLRAGEAFAASKNVEQAESYFKRAIELDPASFHAYVGLAQLLFDAERADEAGAVLKSAEGKVPMTAEVRTLRGNTELRRGRPARALDEFDAALALEENEPAALFGRAVSLRRLGRFDEAVGVFDALVAIDASFPGVAIERGLIHEARGNAALAASEYRKALDERSDDPELLIRLGAAEVRIGEIEAGEARLKRAFEALPNSPEVIHYLGRVALAKGDIPAALERLERAAILEPRNGAYRAELGRARLTAGDIVGARREVLRALELDDSLGDAQWLKGRIALRTGAVRDAIDDLEKALRLAPGRHEALGDLGEAFEQLNKTSYAIRAYERALEAEPGEGRYAHRLGRLLLDDGKRREALAALEKAVALGSAKANAPVWLADSYRLLGDAHRSAKKPADAKRAYERFLEIAPADSIDRAEVARRLRSL